MEIGSLEKDVKAIAVYSDVPVVFYAVFCAVAAQYTAVWRTENNVYERSREFFGNGNGLSIGRSVGGLAWRVCSIFYNIVYNNMV